MAPEVVLAIGIILSVASYFVKNFVLEPVLNYRIVKGRIQNRLKFYGNVLTNSGLPEDTVADARTTMRELSCELEEAYAAIGLREALARVRILPSKSAINDAGSSLIFLSNAANNERYLDATDKAMDDIRKTLKLLA